MPPQGRSQAGEVNPESGPVEIDAPSGYRGAQDIVGRAGGTTVYIQGLVLLILGVTMGVAGAAYVLRQARGATEYMLGTAMSVIGWIMGAVGSLMVLLS